MKKLIAELKREAKSRGLIMADSTFTIALWDKSSELEDGWQVSLDMADERSVRGLLAFVKSFRKQRSVNAKRQAKS